MSGGGSTGPRPQLKMKATAANTKHIAPQRRTVYLIMGTAMARVSREVPRAQAAVEWPLALAATIVSPLLLTFAFPNFDVGVLAFIAVAPLFLLWSKSSWKQAFWWGWLAGTLIFLLLFHWMTHSIGDFIGSWSIVALLLLCSA